MTALILFAKALVVVFFLVMFLRGKSLLWGIGLLTVTSAILLDTFLGTFGRDQMLEELGFFFYVISGALVAGAAIWSWGVIRPLVSPADRSEIIGRDAVKSEGHDSTKSRRTKSQADAANDRQLLIEQMRYQLGPDDLLDLIFDLSLNENDVTGFNCEGAHVVANVVELAEENGQTDDLALAVQRILTPVPAENLPRLEKLNASSPRTVLRHYLLAHYGLEELGQMASDLDIDWEIIAGSDKKAKVRNLLLYLYRRERVDGLITLMQSSPKAGAAPE